MNFLETTMNPIVKLTRSGTWPDAVHELDSDSIWAINMALAAGRPLLVRGKPGTGKSQLARAAAKVLNRLFLATVVNSRTESEDLQFHYDAVHRLAEAQTAGMSATTGDATNKGGRETGGQSHAQKGRSDSPASSLLEHLHPRYFLSPRALWWAFNWQSALTQSNECRLGSHQPVQPKGWVPERGCVLLIDEIDKAEADLPNGLLETLGNGGFSVPLLSLTVTHPDGFPPPLVIITTNEDRELPPAFIRRCLVLHLTLPEKEEAFTQTLMRRGFIHFGERCSETIRRKAAELLFEDRQEALRQGMPAPGQAEYLDLLRALAALKDSGKDPDLIIEHIAGFALKKTPRGSYR